MKEEFAVTGVATSTNAAYATSSTDLSCDYSYATSNSVTTHINEAYSRHLKEEDSTAEYSSPGGAYEMGKNPTYAKEYKTTTIGADAVVTASNQAYSSFKNIVRGAVSNINYDTADVNEDCQDYSYVKI